MTPTEFFEYCGRQALERASNESIAAGARVYLSALASATPLDKPRRTVPVSAELLDGNFGSVVGELGWVPSPRGEDPRGQQVALCPINAHLDLGEVTAGLLLAGAGQVYPEHSHPPQELYYVLSGTGSWRHGGNEHYEDVAPGSTFYNPPGVTHSVKAAPSEPVLAFYILWP